MTDLVFADRRDAGRRLAAVLLPRRYAEPTVLALPRGGVPVGFEVAQALHAPLDVFIVRKLGVPFQPELAMGAVASGGLRVINESVTRELAIDAAVIDRVAEEQQKEIERRELAYREGRRAPEIAGKIVILVDDGLATGSTMMAAARAVRTRGPARVVIAVPVAAPHTCEVVRADADEVVCLAAPERFFAVGQWYGNFDQTTDEEVRELLARAAGA